MATAPELRRNLRLAIDNADTELVVVDLSLVTFISSAAYHALVDATAYAASHRHVLAIRHVQPFHDRILRVCDRAHELNLDPPAALLSTANAAGR
jgi:anti-anti-sigma factor